MKRVRIVLNTFGSFGDVHPYMALALELKERGHVPVVATAEVYRLKIEAAGLEFAPVRPDVGELLSRPELIEKLWHPRIGPEFLIRHYLLPALEQSFEDLLPACRGADLLISHSAAYAGPIVAESKKLKWLSAVLQPLVFSSKFDPPVLSGIPLLSAFHKISGARTNFFLRIAKRVAGGWATPIHALRHRLGLPPSQRNPLFEGQFSPHGTLALFSTHFAAPQPDWPPYTHATGFPFYDYFGPALVGTPPPTASPEPLSQFLAAGSPPVLFTLGSSAVLQPGSFYEESLKAALQFGFRAILLVGVLSQAALPIQDVRNVYVAGYLPYSLVMPRCAAIVHQGGIGATSQALRAKRPTVIVPWAYDQPDNAERVRKLGVSQTISRSRYNAERVGRALQTVLNDRQGYTAKAVAIGNRIDAENGVARACDVIERTLDAR